MDFIIGASVVLFVLTLLLLTQGGRRLTMGRKSPAGRKTKADPEAAQSPSNADIAAGGRKALEELLKRPSVSPPPSLENQPEPDPDASLEENFREKGIVHLDEVRFDGRSANLRPESLPILDEMARVLQGEPASRAMVQGSSNGNIMLAERRARSVARYLTSKGVAARRLETSGSVANAGRLRISPEQVMRNRRVTISRVN